MDEVTLGSHTDGDACAGAVSVQNRTPMTALPGSRDRTSLRILRSVTLADVAIEGLPRAAMSACGAQLAAWMISHQPVSCPVAA
jgi:hypothetical protein